MKIQQVAVVIFLFSASLLAGGCNKESSGPPGVFQHYGTQRAHIHYVDLGDARGTEDVYFDDFGRKEIHISNYEKLTEKSIRPIKTLKLTVGSTITSYEPGRPEGSTWTDPGLDSVYKLSKQDMPSWEKSSMQYLNLGFNKVGTDTVLGITADHWKSKETSMHLYVWKAVLLKRAYYTPNDSTILLAVSIDTTSPINPQFFTVPPGVQLHKLPGPPKTQLGQGQQ